MSDHERQFWRSGGSLGGLRRNRRRLCAIAGNGPVWDDLLVIDNPHLRTWHGLVRHLLFGSLVGLGPSGAKQLLSALAMLTFWISAMTGGHSAASFRFGNVLIHAETP